jgi:hypothetical protein
VRVQLGLGHNNSLYPPVSGYAGLSPAGFRQRQAAGVPGLLFLPGQGFAAGLACFYGGGLGSLGGACLQGGGGRVPGEGDLVLGAAIAVRTRTLVRVISRLDDSPSTVIVFSSCLALVAGLAAGLRHPQLDTVMLEQRGHRRVLAAAERPLVLPGHDRVPPPARADELGGQRGGQRAPGPRQAHATVRDSPTSNSSAAIETRP